MTTTATRRMLLLVLLVAAVVVAPATAKEHKGGDTADAEEVDTSDSEDFRPCGGLSGNPAGSLAKTVSVAGVPVVDGSVVPVGSQVEVAITWDTADFFSLDQLFDCVFVDADGDGNALEDGDLRTDLSDKEKPPPNTGSHVHTYTIPNDAAGKQVCDRARLSGSPSPPNESTQKSNTFCFDAVDALPLSPPVHAYRCEGASVDDPDATLRAYTDDESVETVSFFLTREGGPTSEHVGLAGGGGTWTSVVEDLLPGTYTYEADFGASSGGGCGFTTGEPDAPPVPAEAAYLCEAPDVSNGDATLHGATDDATVDGATFSLTRGDVSTEHTATASGGDGSWSATVTDLAPGDYTYSVTFTNAGDGVATASDASCAFTIASSAPPPASPASTYACSAPTVSGSEATLRGSTDDADVDGATFRLTDPGGVTTDHAGSAANNAWTVNVDDLAAGGYSYEVVFLNGDEAVASAGPGDACRFTIAAAPAAPPAPRPTYTCAAPTASGSTATLRGSTSDPAVDVATFHLTSGGVTTSDAATAADGSWSAIVSDLAPGSYTYTVEFSDGGDTVATAGPGGACRFSVAEPEPEPMRTYRCDPASGVTQTGAVLHATSDHPSVQSATFTLLHGTTSVATVVDGSGAGGFNAQVTGLLPATAYTYTVEFDPGNHAQTNAACGFTTDAATGGAATPTFGSLAVQKNAQLGDGSFPVTINCDGTQFDADVVIETTVGTGTAGPIANIPTGTSCTVTEDVPTGWTATTATTQTVVVDGDEVVAFTNRRNLTLSDPEPSNVSVQKVDTADPVTVGTPFEYVFTVTNDGPLGATGVIVSDTLPDSLTPGTARASQGTCAVTGSALTCALGNLASGAVATVRIGVTPREAGSLENTGAVTSNEADADPSDDLDAETTVIRAKEVSAQSAGSSAAATAGAAGGAGTSESGGSSDGRVAGDPAVAGGQVAGAPALPKTGAALLAGLATGALLIVAGLVLVEVSRTVRRRSLVRAS